MLLFPHTHTETTVVSDLSVVNLNGLWTKFLARSSELFHPVHNEQCHFYMVDCNTGGPGENQWQSSGFSVSSVLSCNAWGLCAQKVVHLTCTSADPSKEYAKFLLRPYYLHAVHYSTLCLSVVRCLLLKCWKWSIMILLFEKS